MEHERIRSEDEEESMERLPYLPPDIVVQIVLRLPVKSILRCASVCKLWRFLLTRPCFTKAYTNLAAKNKDCRQLIVSTYMDWPELKLCPLYSVESYNLDVVKLCHPFGSLFKADKLFSVGSCNGLVCVKKIYRDDLCSNTDLYLWNPSSRECKKLPEVVDHDDGVGNYFRNCFFGFGYDELSDDYKVVVVHKDRYQAFVYKVKVGSWKEIQDFPAAHACEDEKGGIYANGALYWSVNRDRNMAWFPSHIMGLDLRDETYREVVLPYEEENFYLNWSMRAFEGSLVVSCLYDDRVDLWLRKEDSSEPDYWAMMASIRFSGYPAGHLMPLYILNNGEILVENFTEYLLVYSPKDNTLKQIEVDQFGDHYFIVGTYFESLVSPKTEVELQAALEAIEEVQV